MLIEDKVLVGSTNLNYRSLFHDLKLDTLIDDPEIVEQMHHRFVADINLSTEISLWRWQRRNGIQKLLSWFSWFLRYWL